MKNPSSLFATALLLSAFLPMSAFAAAPTPQQNLDLALKRVMVYTPLRMDGEMTVTTNSIPVSKTESPVKSTIHGTFSQRIMSRATGSEQSEGRVVVDRYTVETKAPGQAFSFAGNDAAAVAWKQIQKQSYFQIEKFPIASLPKESSASLKPFVELIGKWIKLDGQTIDTIAARVSPAAASAADASQEAAMNAEMKKIQGMRLFVLTKIEWWKTNADHHRIFRARMRLNPAILDEIYRFEVSLISKQGGDQSVALNALKKQFTDVKASLTKMQFVAEIDDSAGTLKRLELGTTLTTPNQNCHFDSTVKKSVCAKSSDEITTVIAGVTFRKDWGKDVEAPKDWISLQDLMDTVMSELAPTSTVMGPIDQGGAYTSPTSTPPTISDVPPVSTDASSTDPATDRNRTRYADLVAILDLVHQNTTEHQGRLSCGGVVTAIPATATEMMSSGGFDIAACLVPTYASSLPFDPSAQGAGYTDQTAYDTKYFIQYDDMTGRVTVSAPSSELDASIAVSQ